MRVIYPQNDNLAFVGDTMSRGDGAITVKNDNGVEKLFYRKGTLQRGRLPARDPKPPMAVTP